MELTQKEFHSRRDCRDGPCRPGPLSGRGGQSRIGLMARLRYGVLAGMLLFAGAPQALASPNATLVDARVQPALHIKAGDAFLPLRARIIKAGWRPMRIDRGGYEISGTETILANRNIHEFESCTTDAGSLCALFYRKRSACLRVDTIGEQLRHMKVTRWAKECPQPF